MRLLRPNCPLVFLLLAAIAVPVHAEVQSEAALIAKLKQINSPGITPPVPDLLLPKISTLDDRYLYQAQPITRLILKLGQRRVFVYQDQELKTSYPVAIGKRGWETPIGKFKVNRLERNPTWQNPWTNQIVPPSDHNPIGARWIGFWRNHKDEIGFHGTPNQGSIGQAASHGCVRMLNSDVKALFELVTLGTEVEVVP
ncbi:MAG: L,D-transpeptidase [Pseudanabaenaceae cyanobacterium bins.68]|nr:L,D-transpeptidase [Pseudanabaenaceae cyanobacterium bins.68]